MDDGFLERADEVRKRAKRLCRLFYRKGAGFFGCPWECGAGWYRELADMSYEFEALNEFLYRSCRVFVHADQIKEKFGTLRCYYGIYVDPVLPARLLKRALLFLPEALEGKVDFRMKQRELSPQREYAMVDVISRSEYDRLRSKAPSTAFDVFESGGFCFKSTKVISCRRLSAPFPTRFRLLYRTLGLLRRLSGKIQARNSRKTEVMFQYAASKADEIVAKYEKRCYGTCEECGAQIGTKYSARCETHGWIRYVCERCAKARGWKYSKEPCGEDEA